MRSPNRKHQRESFFKYMSAATAHIVLAGGTLRWSSPILFNDPFDVPRELSFGITAEDLVRAASRRAAALLENPPEDTSLLAPKVRLVVETVKKGIDPALKQKLLESVMEVAQSHRPTGESMEALRAMWRAWLPDQRILCLTESPSHAAMWHHYADSYRGAVLEFRCVDELDSAWLAAQPVIYPVAKPPVYTADGWAELLTMPHEAAIRSILHTAMHTKSSDWTYESEWRVASFKRPDDVGPFTDYRFHPLELAGVYVGPMMNSDDRSLLANSAASYPAVRLWTTSITMNREFAFAPDASEETPSK